MLDDIAAVYRASKKKQDINWFTEWVCRPLASVLVWALQSTRITPNQLTLSSLVVCAAACAVWAVVPGSIGAWIGAAVFEVSFVLDCADGQLARLRKTTSQLGHLLDFLVDEIKAFLVFSTLAWRLWRNTGDPMFLAVGVAFLAALATGIALTSFIRHPAYGAPRAGPDGNPHRLRGGVIGLFERAARWVIHYPQYIWALAAIERFDLYFWGYGSVVVAYAGYAFLGVARRLGRFDPRES